MKLALTGSHGVGKSSLLKGLLQSFSNPEDDNPLIRWEREDIETAPNWAATTLVPHWTIPVFDGGPVRKNQELYKTLTAKQKQRRIDWYYVWKHYMTSNFLGAHSIYDTWAYARLTVGLDYHRRLFNWAIQHISYDYVFYLPIEFPLEDDGVRFTDKEFQQAHDKEVKLILDYYHIPYHSLTGSLADRVRQVRLIVGF